MAANRRLTAIGRRLRGSPELGESGWDGIPVCGPRKKETGKHRLNGTGKPRLKHWKRTGKQLGEGLTATGRRLRASPGLGEGANRAGPSSFDLLAFRVEGPVFRVQGLEFRVEGLGFMV